MTTSLRLLASLLLCVACAGCSTTSRRTVPAVQEKTSQSEQPPSTPRASASSNFDFYLLELSWSPEYCKTHASSAQCAQHASFVLHGLWPERADGSYPENCSKSPGPANPSQYKDIYSDLSLLRHEWSTHGTCSGLTPDAFFTAARSALHEVTIPPKLAQLPAATSMAPGDILNLFAASNPGVPRGDFVVSCANNDLSAVGVCVDKSLHPIACGPIKSCRAGSIKVAAP